MRKPAYTVYVIKSVLLIRVIYISFNIEHRIIVSFLFRNNATILSLEHLEFKTWYKLKVAFVYILLTVQIYYGCKQTRAMI